MKKSKLGYKRYSPDVNNPYNIIPSGRITMRDVDFPVYGVDNMGNAQMMYPGGEYQFPGNQVFELPMAQSGGERQPIYTSNPNDPRLKAYSDSLNLYKKTLDIENPEYYEDGKPSWYKFKGNREQAEKFMERNNIDHNYEYSATGKFPGKIQPQSTGYFGEGMAYPKYKKPVQPVEYKPIEKATVKPKDDPFLVSKKDFGPQKSLPKSINNIKQDASGANVYVTINGKTSVIPKRDYFSWRAENKDLYDAYTTKRAYGGEELLIAQVGATMPQPFIRPDFFTPEQIRKARIDAAKDRPLTFEGRVNEALGNPKEKAADLAQAVAPRGEGPVDNVRHTVAGMYTADAIANKLSPYPIGPAAVVPKIAGFMGSNLAGLAHEVRAFVPSLEGDYRNIPAAARMTAEDIVNNFVGSALSLNPFMTQGEKEELIVRLSNENYLPDGYEQMNPEHPRNLYVKKQYGGDLEEFGSGGLKQWFAEKWVDVKTGKECGRSGKDKNGRPYPACRPSRRVNSTTPKTTSEMSSSEKAKFKSIKTSGKRIPYNHKRKQMGGFMMPEGLSPAFFTGMKDAVVDAFKSFMASPEKSETKPVQTDWTKMKRPDQIKYGIDQIVALEPENKRKSLENLLEATAYMENRYGADPRAYGRNYTSSFMSIDPIALKDMFTGRGDKGTYNAAQRAQIENFKRLNLPTDQRQFDSRLREDDPVAAMAAARYRYAMSPQALPDPNNPQQMFDYWLTNYNGKGVLKHQTREQAYKEFLKGYKMALAND